MNEIATVSEDRVVDFDIYAPPAVHDGFHQSWKSLQVEGLPSVVWTPHNGGHWIATRAPTINKVLADYKRFSSRTIFVPKETAGAAYRGALPGTVDPPEHKAYRTLLNARLSPSIVKAMETQIRHHAALLVEAVREDGACDFAHAFSELFPIQVLMSLTDMPIADVPKLRGWAAAMVRPSGDLDFAKGKQNFLDYLAPYVDARKDKGGEDLFSHLINTPIDGRTLTRDEALNFCFLVLFGGVDTVVQFLNYVMHFVATNPDRWREMMANPDQMPRVIEELLRRFPVITIAREVTQDTEIEGAQLKAGDMIVAALALAGIDDQQHENPMAVDFGRKKLEHATFGGGAHRCPGNHLARMEIRVMLEEWLRRIPEFRIDPNEKPLFKGGITASIENMKFVWDPTTTHRIELMEPSRAYA